VGDELEEDRGLHLGALDVADVVEDEQLVLVELGQGVGELEGLLGDLERLDEEGGGGEADPEALGNQAVADGTGDMGLADPRGAKEEEILGPFDESRRRRPGPRPVGAAARGWRRSRGGGGSWRAAAATL
jgi:hypothetical protein